MITTSGVMTRPGIAEARIIFIDTEVSNWTYDPEAGQYFWHRFFSNQPDLNYDNPAVQEEMLNIVRYWLDMGWTVSGATPCPISLSGKGTICENLPETHEFLQSCGAWSTTSSQGDPAGRGQPVARGRGRILRQEHEFHMAFHFPLMPRMFMAMRREDRIPIVEILTRTPPIPENAQWAIFLRNHDELTLEMVTDEERDYMYSEYAKDRDAASNLGIRRRLAPLLENSRRKIELMTRSCCRSLARP